MFFQLVTTYIYRNWEVLFPRLGLNAQTALSIATHVTADRKYENLQYLIQRHKKRTPVPSGSQKKKSFSLRNSQYLGYIFFDHCLSNRSQYCDHFANGVVQSACARGYQEFSYIGLSDMDSSISSNFWTWEDRILYGTMYTLKPNGLIRMHYPSQCLLVISNRLDDSTPTLIASCRTFGLTGKYLGPPQTHPRTLPIDRSLSNTQRVP